MVTDNSVINAPIYFKLFECGKNFMKNIDAAYEQLCMENFWENGIQKILGMDKREC